MTSKIFKKSRRIGSIHKQIVREWTQQAKKKLEKLKEGKENDSREKSVDEIAGDTEKTGNVK